MLYQNKKPPMYYINAPNQPVNTDFVPKSYLTSVFIEVYVFKLVMY